MSKNENDTMTAYIVTTNTGRQVMVYCTDRSRVEMVAWSGYAIKSFDIVDVLPMV